MRYGVGAIGRIQEQDTRFAVMMGLFDYLIEQFPGAHLPVSLDTHTSFFHLFQRTTHVAIFGVVHIGETQFPVGVVANGAHKCIGDAHRYVEVGYLILIALAGNELFHIGMVYAQHAHISAAAGATLCNLAEGMVIDSQESHRTRGLAGRRINQRTFGPQTREGETVAAPGLLDQGGIPQGLENPRAVTTHVIGDRQHEAGCQLSKGCTCAGKRRGVGEELLAGQ